MRALLQVFCLYLCAAGADTGALRAAKAAAVPAADLPLPPGPQGGALQPPAREGEDAIVLHSAARREGDDALPQAAMHTLLAAAAPPTGVLPPQRRMDYSEVDKHAAAARPLLAAPPVRTLPRKDTMRPSSPKTRAVPPSGRTRMSAPPHAPEGGDGAVALKYAAAAPAPALTPHDLASACVFLNYLPDSALDSDSGMLTSEATVVLTSAIQAVAANVCVACRVELRAVADSAKKKMLFGGASAIPLPLLLQQERGGIIVSFEATEGAVPMLAAFRAAVTSSSFAIAITAVLANSSYFKDVIATVTRTNEVQEEGAALPTTLSSSRDLAQQHSLSRNLYTGASLASFWYSTVTWAAGCTESGSCARFQSVSPAVIFDSQMQNNYAASRSYLTVFWQPLITRQVSFIFKFLDVRTDDVLKVVFIDATHDE
jgi:hypothetical protein